MKKYLSEHDVIIDLHQKGYDHDFKLSGNDLYLLQENILVRVGDFSIEEYYRFENQRDNFSESIVFGITAYSLNIKGILIRHFDNNSLKQAPVIRKKMNEMLMGCN